MAHIQEPIELPRIHSSHRHDLSSTELDTHSDVAVTDVTDVNHDSDDEAPLNETSLPPADGGFNAWLFLLAAFMLEALVWGFAFTFGIFQDYYSDHELFREDSASLASVGTAQSGIMYIGMLPMMYSLLKFPEFGKWSLTIGLVIMCIALAASSFASDVKTLIATQGVLYGIGGSLAYCPGLLWLEEWFVRKLGFAYGIMWAGAGIAGTVFPLIISAALHKYGFRTVLRAWSIASLILIAPLIPFVKPRIPPTQGRRFSWEFLRSPGFLLFQVGNVVQGLGYFLPQIYLPTIADEMGASALMSTLTLVLLNLSGVAGNVIMGSLLDRWHVTTCIAICSIGASISVLVFLGTSVNLPLLYVFCILYGFFAGSFSVSYSGIMRVVGKSVARTEPGIVMGTLGLGRGVGNTISGPLSAALLNGEKLQAAMAYGSWFGPLILFTGLSALIGGISVIGRLKGGLFPKD